MSGDVQEARGSDCSIFLISSDHHLGVTLENGGPRLSAHRSNCYDVRPYFPTQPGMIWRTWVMRHAGFLEGYSAQALWHCGR